MFKTSDNIGPYSIVRKLGQGGMGAVYEVVHLKLGVHYALKTFVLDHGHIKLLKERFLAEGRILARLRHPNLVRVFDLDVDAATGVPYFVMDLVQYKDGDSYTLADLEPGGADEEHLARWFGQLCSALDYIHAAGIVHRDIKLGNILLNAQGGIVLSDFGVSRFSGDEIRCALNIEHTIVTGDTTTGNLVMGTSGYMAPEVKRGEDATAASDAYSLGVVFLRLLTGVWYENRPNIWSLLEPFDGPWREILPQLLAEDPKMRPLPLTPIARRVAEGCGTAAPGATPDLAPALSESDQLRLDAAIPSPVSGRKVSSRLFYLIAALLLVFVGGWLAWRFILSGDSLHTDDLYSIPVSISQR